MTPEHMNDEAVERILNAIASVNVTLARVEARIDNLIRDTKDHEGRLRVLEHDQVNVRLLKNDIDDHIKSGLVVLTGKVDELESDRDSVRGFMKAVAIITPAVSGIVTSGIMLLVKLYGAG